MKQPTLTVIMPNYNHARFLPEALQAIIDQSFPPMEIIVLDDGSTDNSVEVIEGFARKDSRIRLVCNERNMGVEYSVQRLLSLASGDYFYSAGADDLVLPGFFEKSMHLLAQYPQAGLCSTTSKTIDVASGKVIGLLPPESISKDACYISPSQALTWLCRKESWLMGNTCIYNRELLLEAGGFIPELYAFCDGFIQLVIALKCGVCFVPETLAVWRLSTSGHAYTSSSDIDISLKMWSFAAQLMRTTYADLFPVDFVNTWEKRKLTHARISALNKLQKQQMDIVRGIWDHESLADRIFMAWQWGVMRMLFGLLMAFLLVRDRGNMWPVLIRGIRVKLQQFRIT